MTTTPANSVNQAVGVEPVAAENWREAALCAQTDPEAFFPEKGQPTGPAKHTCAACQVRVYCLEWALEHNERHGIWGGLSTQQRRRLRHQRRTTAGNADGGSAGTGEAA